MSGFLDRLAARAVGEAPLLHPRVRSRHEPGSEGAPGESVETVGEVVEERSAPARPAVGDESFVAPRVEVRSPVVTPPRTLEPEPRGLTSEDRTMPAARLASAPPPALLERPVASREEIVEEPETAESRLRRDPHPLTPSPTRPGEGERRPPASPGPVLAREVAPPLPGEGSAGGRGGRGVRVYEAVQSSELHDTRESAIPPPAPPRQPARSRLAPEPSEPPPRPQPLRPGRREAPAPALAAELPTVEADRGASLPPSLDMEESEPSETVVHVSIGRIDVRAAAQPPAPERRPARPAGPRLTLADYLQRREERRR